MSARYHITVADCAGPFDSIEAPDLPTARAVAARCKAEWPRKSVVISDNERDGREIDPEDDDADC